MARLWMVVALASVLGACHVEPRPEPAAEPQRISRAAVDRELESVYERFREAYRCADPEAVVELYAPDAFYLQPDRGILRGRDAIGQVFAGILGPAREQGQPGPEIAFHIVDRDVRDDLAYDIGYYTLGGGEPAGKFVLLWKRGADGTWRIHADGFSRMRPTAAGQP